MNFVSGTLDGSSVLMVVVTMKTVLIVALSVVAYYYLTPILAKWSVSRLVSSVRKAITPLVTRAMCWYHSRFGPSYPAKEKLFCLELFMSDSVSVRKCDLDKHYFFEFVNEGIGSMDKTGDALQRLTFPHHGRVLRGVQFSDVWKILVVGEDECWKEPGRMEMVYTDKWCEKIAKSYSAEDTVSVPIECVEEQTMCHRLIGADIFVYPEATSEKIAIVSPETPMYIDGDDITCHQKSFPYIRQWVWDKKAVTRENALCGLRTAFSAIKPLADTIKASDECEVVVRMHFSDNSLIYLHCPIAWPKST
jgi:hypothetical protein